MHEQHYFTLALSQVKNIGPVLGKLLIQKCGSAEAVFKEKQKNLLKINGVGTAITNALKNSIWFHKTEKELRYTGDHKITVLNYSDPLYPEQLKHCFDAPMILFYQGQIDGLQKRPISIVGTRQMTSYGKDFLDGFFVHLGAYDPTVVSGLAYGIDAHAHRLAINHQLKTVAVLAHGFKYMYPNTHAALAQKIAEGGGLLTEYWSDTPVAKENFIKRNRIIAGVSEATLVIESASKGGSLITAEFANSYNRDVFALPGRVGDIYSAGCNQLIKTNRAAVLSSVQDLCYLLNWDSTQRIENTSLRKDVVDSLKTSEQKIYTYLQQIKKQSLDLIASHCNYSVQKTAALLLNLELKDLIRPLPGKYYETK